MVEATGRIVIGARTFPFRLDPASPVAARLRDRLPLHGAANNIGGEIWFRTWGLDLPYDGTERVDFQEGDLVYWRSPEGDGRFCIALFFGNTSFGGWARVQAGSPCVRVGRLLGDLEGLAAVPTGETLIMERTSS